MRQIRHNILLFGLLFLFFGSGRMVFAAGWGIPPVSFLAGSPVLVGFDGLWHSVDGEDEVVPFIDFKAEKVDIFRSFALGDYQQLPDTLMLYVYGVGNTAEVWLNERLLGIVAEPFSEHYFRVDKDWLQSQGNRLLLRLRREGIKRPFNTQPFVGIIGPIALLATSEKPSPPAITLVDHCDSALGLAWWPWSGDFAQLPRDWRAALYEIKQSGIRTLYFPHMPPRSALAEADFMGFEVIRKPSDAGYFAWFRAYPLADPTMQDTMRFWRDQAGVVTSDYGNLHPGLEEGALVVDEPDELALLLILLLPWLALLIIKIWIPKVFEALSEFLVKTNLQIDLIREDKFLKSGQANLMLLFRLLTLAAIISLYLYFLQIHGWERRLNILSEESLLYLGMVGRVPGLLEIFLQAFGVLAGLSVVKYVFLSVLGWIYRQYNLSALIRDLDTVSSFPVTWLLCIPPALLFFSEGITTQIVWIAWQVLILIYYMRRLLLIFQGFNSLVAFSSHIKILYICALEILPWVILI